MFKIWLEWDYGQDSFVFTTKEKAIQWVTDLKIENYEFEGQGDFLDYSMLYEEGLCFIEELEVDPTS